MRIIEDFGIEIVDHYQNPYGEIYFNNINKNSSEEINLDNEFNLSHISIDNLNTSNQSVMGHSMGGHGALLMALRLNNQFKSVSAFAPICNPMKSDWGRKQFSAYLGSDESLWQNYDASVIAQKTNFSGPILIDTGSNDQFLNLLSVDSLSKVLKKRGLAANVRMNDGYDHSYYFIATFMEEHINFHAAALYKN